MFEKTEKQKNFVFSIMVHLLLRSTRFAFIEPITSQLSIELFTFRLKANYYN